MLTGSQMYLLSQREFESHCELMRCWMQRVKERTDLISKVQIGCLLRSFDCEGEPGLGAVGAGTKRCDGERLRPRAA